MDVVKCSVCDKTVSRHLHFSKYNKIFCSIECINKTFTKEEQKDEKRIVYHTSNSGVLSF